jgi:preprotein translocase subunit YajC
VHSWPYLIVLALLVVMFLVSRRTRRRQAEAETRRNASIRVGSEVMTTAGLYGTVVARNTEDNTVTLSIAPGVEVKWALAAIRELTELPQQYRRGVYDQSSGADGPRSIDDDPPAP